MIQKYPLGTVVSFPTSEDSRALASVVSAKYAVTEIVNNVPVYDRTVVEYVLEGRENELWPEKDLQPE